MPAYRFPILLLQDPAGGHTATLVEDDGDIAALGGTPAEARERLRDYLERTYRNLPWYPPPDFDAPQLSLMRVEVRAQYTSQRRTYPCSETIPLRVAVVTGRTRAGLLVAALPTLAIRFNYYAPDDLKPLVTQYVQGRFRDHTPAQISRYLLPTAVDLDDIVIQVPREPRERETDADLAELSAVADPLAARELRSRYPRAWERDDLITRLVEAIRKESAPILLLGESGVGKTTILADASRRIERAADAIEASAFPNADADAMASRRTKRINRFWLTSAPRFIAGMQYLGMWQERVENIISQTASIAGVLCIENLLDLVRTGGRSPGDSIAAYLMPYLQRAELRLIAEATPAELDAIRRLLPGLADLFQIITVPPFARPQAIACLSQIAAAHRQNLKIDVERGLVETVYRLFARFMPYHPFPGKAAAFVADLFDRAARADGERVSASDAIELFVRQTGVAELFLRDELPLDSENVVSTLHQEVIGQQQACRAAAAVVTTFKAGLNDPNRPLGVLLFTGPTGVGKTQLAQSLARYLYGGSTDAAKPTGQRLVRLDMSEYAGPDAAERFLGSPQSGPADWIQKIRQQPFTVLLLDEIEKAAPAIFDILLGVFDEGRLTDPWGRLTHFKSAVIIMTSNLGAATAQPFGLSRNDSPAYESEAMGFFRPEFFNRIDAVVTFDPLTPPTIRAIAEKELRDLSQREGLTRSGISLQWTTALLDHLSREGFDPRYGARPLQRAIETLIVTPLSKYLVDNHVTGGALLIDITSAGQLTITPSS